MLPIDDARKCVAQPADPLPRPAATVRLARLVEERRQLHVGHLPDQTQQQPHLRAATASVPLQCLFTGRASACTVHQPPACPEVGIKVWDALGARCIHLDVLYIHAGAMCDCAVPRLL